MSNPADPIRDRVLKTILRRPAVFALLFLVAGILIHSWFPGFFLPILTLTVGAVALTCHFLPIHPGLRWLPIALLLLLIGAWRADQDSTSRQGTLEDWIPAQSLPMTFRGTVSRDPTDSPGGTVVVLDKTSVEIDRADLPLAGLLSMRLDSSAARPEYGDRVQIWGHLSLPEPKRNPGGIDWESVYRRQGIVARLYPQSPSDVTAIGLGNKSPVLTEFAYPLRHRILDQIHYWFPQASQPLVAAALLGETEELDPDLMQATRRSGVAHLLVVSGFNVGIIAVFLIGVLAILRLPFSVRLTMGLIAVAVFALITEWRPPVLRAAIMAAILGGSYLVNRRWDSWNTLAAAAFLLLLFRPGDLSDVGCQLSFAAVASMLFFYPNFHRLLMRFRFSARIRRIPAVGPWIYDGLLIAICAQIGTLPIVAAQFGRIPTLGVVATVLSAPLIILIIPLSLVVVVLGAVGIPQTAWIAEFVALLVSLFEKLTYYVSAISYSSVKIGGLNYLVIVALFLVIYLSWQCRRLWARWAVAVCLVFVLNVAVWSHGESESFDKSDLPIAMEVTYLDVGQGSAAIIRLAGGRSLLLDGGPLKPVFPAGGSEWDAGEHAVIPCLQEYGIDTLDAVIVSHDDGDHLGGLLSVIEKIAVRRVYWSGIGGGSEIFHRFEEVLEKHHIAPIQITAGQLIPDFGSVSIRVLHPDSAASAYSDASNDVSLVLQIQLGQVKFLFPGDVESQTENSLLRYSDLLKSDVLLIPHHGSASSNSEAFLKAVSPHTAVISVGQRNMYNHPSPVTLSRLHALDCQIERTDLTGAVVLRTDGQRIWKYDGWR